MQLKRFYTYHSSRYNSETKELEYYYDTEIELEDKSKTKIEVKLSEETMKKILAIISEDIEEKTNNFINELRESL
jgi:hypothetical protein